MYGNVNTGFGMVEVCIYGQWTAICSATDYISYNTLETICKSLGYLYV